MLFNCNELKLSERGREEGVYSSMVRSLSAKCLHNMPQHKDFDLFIKVI